MGYQDCSTFLILAASSLPLVPIIISLLYMPYKSFLNSCSPLQLSDLLITHLRSAYRFVIYVLATKYSIRSNPDLIEMECSICRSKVEDGEEGTELMCAHVFHKVCLDSWFTCPICCSQIKSCRAMEKGENGEERVIIHLKLMQPARASRRTRDHGDNFWLR